MNFSNYIGLKLGDKWAICRDTVKNRARYGKCITLAQYEAIRNDFEKYKVTEKRFN